MEKQGVKRTLSCLLLLCTIDTYLQKKIQIPEFQFKTKKTTPHIRNLFRWIKSLVFSCRETAGAEPASLQCVQHTPNMVISSLKAAAVKPSHGEQDLFLFLSWGHPSHTWAGAFRRCLWTCQLQKEKESIMIIIPPGNRQELGKAPRLSIPESLQRSIHGDHRD